MWISSRTPEGEPHVCDICGHEFTLEPSLLTRDAPCPNCGALAWFGEAPVGFDEAEQAVVDAMRIRDRVFYLAIAKFGWPITADLSFIGELPNDYGAAWRRALEAARDWGEFAALLPANDRGDAAGG